MPLLGQVVDEYAHEVDGDEDDDVGDHRLPLSDEMKLGVQDDDTDDGVDTWEEETVGDRHPSSTK